jgi:hypothetical protein
MTTGRNQSEASPQSTMIERSFTRSQPSIVRLNTHAKGMAFTFLCNCISSFNYFKTLFLVFFTTGVGASFPIVEAFGRRWKMYSRLVFISTKPFAIGIPPMIQVVAINERTFHASFVFGGNFHWISAHYVYDQ